MPSGSPRIASAWTSMEPSACASVPDPFGTLKRWFGWDHFLVRGFEKVGGEMSIMVLGYNLTRVINTLGVRAFTDYCARREHIKEYIGPTSNGRVS
jgi:hypothetical protein